MQNRYLETNRVNWGIYDSRQGAIKALVDFSDGELTKEDFRESTDEEIKGQLDDINKEKEIEEAIALLTENGYIVTKK